LGALAVIQVFTTGHRRTIMRNLFAAGVACALILTIAGTAAWADTTPEPSLLKVYANSQTEMGSRLSELQAALQAKPVAAWTEAEERDYLETALWYVFSGVAIYERVEGRLPASLDELVAQEYLPAAPLNPFNDWQPMVLRADDLEFHPGDLCLQRYALTDNHPRRLRACELGVFGPSLDFPAGEIDMQKFNQDWAVIPDGTAYQLGFNRQLGGPLP
jgi:hypothetical protein